MSRQPTVVCAPDKLRGALDADRAAQALVRGARRAGWRGLAHPLADGGEGTRDIIVRARGGMLVDVPTVDARGRATVAALGWLDDGTAVVEAAAAVGLAQLARDERDPMRASSAGVAPLVTAALDRGARRIVACLGGSATVDGGLGLLRGLGCRMLDGDGRELAGTGADTGRVARIERAGLEPRLAGVELVVALDVQSPLTGAEGAARVFGPQKGASPRDVELLDEGLARVGALLGAAADAAGAGAAGGLGAALLWLGARPEAGADRVMAETGFAQRLAGASLCITAEGKVDGQSAAGKTVARVAAACREAGVPCVVLGGRVESAADALYGVGASAVLGIGRAPRSLRQALRATEHDLAAAARAVCGLAQAARTP